jgi:uncharacterized protein
MNNTESKGFTKIMLILSILVFGTFGLATYYVTKNPNSLKSEYTIPMNFEKLEVQKTTEERELGLQNRTELCNKCGMLFVWEEAQVLNFWMLNTFVPIDIIYLDEANFVKTIISKPELNNSSKTYSSLVPVTKALEIPSKRTAELNIKVGTKLLFDY